MVEGMSACSDSEDLKNPSTSGGFLPINNEPTRPSVGIVASFPSRKTKGVAANLLWHFEHPGPNVALTLGPVSFPL
jgi:hypothetical protein